MELAELQQLWSIDCEIDQYDLATEALKIPKLFAKYYKLYLEERLTAVALQTKLRALKLEKYEFYTMGPTSETPKTWVLPDFGKVLKADVARYMDADRDLLQAEFELSVQTEKAKFLEAIINGFRERGFAIKNAIDMIKFQSGS